MGGFDITNNETESSVQGGELTHAMDVFSLGLVWVLRDCWELSPHGDNTDKSQLVNSHEYTCLNQIYIIFPVVILYKEEIRKYQGVTEFKWINFAIKKIQKKLMLCWAGTSVIL